MCVHFRGDAVDDNAADDDGGERWSGVHGDGRPLHIQTDAQVSGSLQLVTTALMLATKLWLSVHQLATENEQE